MFSFTLPIIFLALVAEVNGAGKCHPRCKTCHEHLSTYCSSCDDGLFLPTYSSFRLCMVCNAKCLKCKDVPNNCQECIKGRHGPACDMQCSEGCADGNCDQLTANCTCKKYFTGEKCDSCVPGRYGTDCLTLCSNGCFNDTCSVDTGECICKNGYTGLTCNRCIANRYGPFCQLECSTGCMEDTCYRQAGMCVCKADYIGEKCDQCVHGKYDLQFNCSRPCPMQCLSCQSDQVCIKCKPGFYGSNCLSLCSSRCRHGNCSKEEGNCHSCKLEYAGVKCERCQEPGKFGNDCNQTCKANCLACSTGDTCDECKTGFWGTDCSKQCSTGCFEKDCNQIDGACLHGCTRGLSGIHCNCDLGGYCTNIGKSTNNGIGQRHKSETTLLPVFVIVCSFVFNVLIETPW